jgi:hypothetical protein
VFFLELQAGRQIAAVNRISSQALQEELRRGEDVQTSGCVRAAKSRVFTGKTINWI